jgi:hypothetical protein
MARIYAPKPAPKPVRKPAPKPAPKPVRKPTPKPAPLDLVRNPNFDAAMAQQRYNQMLAEMTARAKAGQFDTRIDDVGQLPPQSPQAGGNFTQGRLMGAPSGQGGLGGMTADQAGIPADQRKILDDLMARDQVNFAANEAKRQDFMKTQKPVGGSIAGPIYGSLAGNVLANGAPANMSPDQLNAMRMQQYNQFLGQGMQNSNTLNQDAMTNFANMQAGIESTQPATATTPKPAMPIAGMGMQKSSPAPRKFSITSNPQVKAF